MYNMYIWIWIWILVFNATFSNISAISYTSTRREPPTLVKQLVNFITCGCESSAPFLICAFVYPFHSHKCKCSSVKNEPNRFIYREWSIQTKEYKTVFATSLTSRQHEGIKSTIPSHGSERSCFYVSKAFYPCFFMIFLLDFGTVSTVWHFQFTIQFCIKPTRHGTH